MYTVYINILNGKQNSLVLPNDHIFHSNFDWRNIPLLIIKKPKHKASALIRAHSLTHSLALYVMCRHACLPIIH